MNLEELREKLNKKSNESVYGDHAKVAVACGISRSYLLQIKREDALIIDCVEARKLIIKLIKAYQQLHIDRKEALEKFEKELEENG